MEANVMRADDILDDELGQVHILVLVNFFDRLCVVFGCLLAHFLSLGASTDHLAACEDECRGFGVSNTHDCGCKPLRLVLHVFAAEGNQFKVQFAI
jgi:hypothetical protein